MFEKTKKRIAKAKERRQEILKRIRNRDLVNTKFDERCLIVADLDGTLLDKDCKIRKYTRDVVRKLTKEGHIFCIVTARPKRSCIHYYKQLGLKTPMASYNGARIYNPNNPGFSTINYYINTEIIFKIFENPTIKKYVENVILETPDGTYFLNKFKKGKTQQDVQKELAKFNIYTTEDIHIVDGRFKRLKWGAWAILVSLNDMTKGVEFANEVNKVCSSVIVRSWTEEHVGCIIEINSIFPSKGSALRFLSAYYDIPLDRCYSFGDNENDVEMLIAAKNSYAMKNGFDYAKKAASKTTKYTNHEEGVARELNQIFKLGINYPKTKNEGIKNLKKLTADSK